MSGPENAGAEAPVSRPFAVTHRSVLAITLPMTLAFLTTPLLGLTDIAVAGGSATPRRWPASSSAR